MPSRVQRLVTALIPQRPRLAQLVVLVALLALAVAGASHTRPSYAGVVLKPGDYVVGTFHKVSALDQAGGPILVLSNHSSFEIPALVAAGPRGEVYVADNYFGNPDQRTIARVDPATGTPTVVASGGFGFVGGLTVEPSGKLLVADNGGSQIVRVDPTNGNRTMVSLSGSLHKPVDVAIEADGSVLTTAAISANPATNDPRQILRIRAGTNAQEVVSTGGLLKTPAFLAVAPDGTIFTTDTGGNVIPDRVIRVHPQTGVQSVVTQFDSGFVAGIVVDSAGMLIVGHSNGIYRVDPGTGQHTLLGHANGADLPQGIAIVKVASEVSCSPRPRVTVGTTNLGNGRLRVSIKVTGDGNTIRAVQLGTPSNAVPDGQTVVVGPDASFVIKRTGPGAASIPFTVVDGCGEWKSFAGGGPNAF